MFLLIFVASTTAGEELTDSEDVSYESCPVTSETIKHDCVPVSLHLKEDNVGGSPKQRTIHSVMLETHRESNSDATAEEDEQERDDLSRGSVLQNTPQDSAHETGPSEFKDYDVTGNVNESHSDDMVDNKMEHSCTFVVEQLYGHNGIVRTVSLIDDFLVTGR
jgi:hypothetical protein